MSAAMLRPGGSIDLAVLESEELTRLDKHPQREAVQS